MRADYYQNIVYPLQDKVLKIIGDLPVGFYLTGGTVLSRAYLNHRHSDDLDFFLNGALDFKQQVNTVIDVLSASGLQYDVSVADESYARIFIPESDCSLKLDFVNDIPYRYGTPSDTVLFIRTDNILNILLNKLTALGRYASKDVVDIVYICESVQFNWETIFNDASEKDLWANPVNAAEILEKFPVKKLEEIVWTGKIPSNEWFLSRISQIIPDILEGKDNSLFKRS
jgi:hypothetical protein